MRLPAAATARAVFVFALAVVGVTPALTAGGPAGALPTSGVPRQTSTATGLESFPDCDALLAHLKDVALAHVGPYGFGGPAYGPFFATGQTFAASGGVTAGGADGGRPVAGTDFSTTNNQEAGADEADTVKTDGRRLVVLRNGVVSVTDVTNPAKPVRRSRLALLPADQGGFDASLLLQGDRVLVLLPRWRPFAKPSDSPGFGFFANGEPVTDVAMLSIADPSRPKVLDRVTLDGSLVAARLVGGAARLVVGSLPLNLAFVTPQSVKGNAAALAANRKIIQESTIADWLPTLQRGGTSSAAVQCQDVRTPATFAGIGMTSIHTVAMGNLVQPTSVSLQADAATAYASTKHVYVTAAAWVDPATYSDPRVWDRLANSFRTDIHEFDITGAKASYVASGQVRGHAINQWALSEYADQLRIATTDGPTWVRPGGSRPRSESFMTVFAARNGMLAQVGQVGGIGRGEQIQAVRYDGTTGYVVTFRQIDPFFVLDLSQPNRPAVVGQLKVAGYSGYLHPIGAGRVIGVGADATRQGQITGARVTLFDVSDLRHPKALSSWVQAGSQTQVEFDAKAFLWWNPTNLAVVPTVSFSPTGINGAVGLRVTSKSISTIGFISHERSGPKGVTACRPLGLPEIKAASNGRLVGFVVIDCAPRQAVAVTGFSCTPYSIAEINKAYNAHFRAAADHRFGVCVLARPEPVQRSIVIRDRLLTLTQRDLLSSDLRTLKPGVIIDF